MVIQVLAVFLDLAELMVKVVILESRVGVVKAAILVLAEYQDIAEYQAIAVILVLADILVLVDIQVKVVIQGILEAVLVAILVTQVL